MRQSVYNSWHWQDVFLGSSMVERPAVNRLVVGSNPSRGVPERADAEEVSARFRVSEAVVQSRRESVDGDCPRTYSVAGNEVRPVTQGASTRFGLSNTRGIYYA